MHGIRSLQGFGSPRLRNIQPEQRTPLDHSELLAPELDEPVYLVTLPGNEEETFLLQHAVWNFAEVENDPKESRHGLIAHEMQGDKEMAVSRLRKPMVQILRNRILSGENKDMFVYKSGLRAVLIGRLSLDSLPVVEDEDY